MGHRSGSQLTATLTRNTLNAGAATGSASIGAPALGHAEVLGERSAARPEHFVTDFELTHVPAHRLHRPGEVLARADILGPAEAGLEAHDAGLAAHVVPVQRIDRGGAHPDEDVVVRHGGPRHLLELEHVGRAVAAVDHRTHARRPRERRWRFAAAPTRGTSAIVQFIGWPPDAGVE